MNERDELFQVQSLMTETLIELRRLRAEKGELVAALKECSDELEAEIEHRLHAVKHHMITDYERDMTPVKDARALLAKVTAGGVIDTFDVAELEAQKRRQDQGERRR
jgi:hypothetical protein